MFDEVITGRPRNPYEIVATLGPATESEETWSALLDAGATAFRLNTSHLKPTETSQWLERLARFFAGRASAGTGNGHRTPGNGDRAKPQPVVPVILDLQGSKWRIGDVEARTLQEDDRVVFLLDPNDAVAGSGIEMGEVVIPVPHADFFQAAAASGDSVLLNDGRVLVRLDRDRAAARLAGTVRRGGNISARKGITIPSSPFRAEALSERDRSIISDAEPFSFVEFALSYVRDEVEMERYRAAIPAGRRVAAKIERAPAVEAIREIADYADQLWICRGDMGAELGIVAMARVVREIEHILHGGGESAIGVAVLLAGQVLEHMVEHPEPTRAEVCQLYDAHEAGYAGVVLSDETAVGRFPVESVQNAALFR